MPFMSTRKLSKKSSSSSKVKLKSKPKTKAKSKSKSKAKPKAKSKSKIVPKRKLAKKLKPITRETLSLKPIGVVTHFFSKLGVAIVKFNTKVLLGTKLQFKGATTDFTEVIESMQYNHQPIREAKKGQEVGIKVNEKVREGDEVFRAE